MSEMQPVSQELDYLGPSSGYNQSPCLSERSSQQSSLLSSPEDKPILHKHPHSLWSSMSWKWQILGWIGSLCFFIAIILILRVWDGRAIPDLRFGITPNALIGLLATFTELLLLAPVNSAFGQLKWLRALRKRPMDDFRTIDEASRGPWGSALLLARRAGGTIGSFGAVITVLSLGISTFSQQALKYDTIYPHSADARMPIAQDVNGSGWAPIGGGVSLLGVDYELLSAPYVAFFGKSKTNYAISAQCGTGNCTWEFYQTLGICNTCENLTSKLKMTKVKIDDDYTDHYTLPNGFGITGNKFDSNGIPSAALVNITTTLPSEWTMKLDDWKSVAFAQNGLKLLSVFAVGSSPGTLPVQPDVEKTFDPMTGSQFAPPMAYECMLQLCVRNMRARFTNGTLTETEVSTWTDQSLSRSKSINDDMTLRSPGSKTAFYATGEAVAGITSWLTYLLVGNATLSSVNSHWGISEAATYSSEVLRSIHSAMNRTTTGFPDLMENLAYSLSLNLREIPYQPSPVQGEAYSATSHAVVTWPWLILPAFELIGSLVFLTTVMIGTRRKKLVTWTNNPLAYFFHGLDERPPHQHLHDSQIEMERDARKLFVEFQTHDNNHHLVIVGK